MTESNRRWQRLRVYSANPFHLGATPRIRQIGRQPRRSIRMVMTTEMVHGDDSSSEFVVVKRNRPTDCLWLRGEGSNHRPVLLARQAPHHCGPWNTKNLGGDGRSRTGKMPECKSGAVPIEPHPQRCDRYDRYEKQDSNLRPFGSKPNALTRLSYSRVVWAVGLEPTISRIRNERDTTSLRPAAIR